MRAAARHPMLATTAVAAGLLCVLFAAGCTNSSTHATAPTTGSADGSAPASGSAAGSTLSATRPTPSPTSTVPDLPGATRSPVPISSAASFGAGVTARIAQVKAVQGQAKLPGEISGPAVAVTIELSNQSSRVVAINPVVNLYYGAAQTPAGTIAGPPTQPFASQLAAGAAARGTYTFTVSAAERDLVRIEFSYTPGAPTVLWQGAAA